MAPSAAAGTPRAAAALSIGAGAGTPTSSAAPSDAKLTRTIMQMVKTMAILHPSIFSSSSDTNSQVTSGRSVLMLLV
ncbi:hypothetical protein ACFX13_037241 [Malus domestica]